MRALAGFKKDRILSFDKIARFSGAEDSAGNQLFCLFKKLQAPRYVQSFKVFHEKNLLQQASKAGRGIRSAPPPDQGLKVEASTLSSPFDEFLRLFAVMPQGIFPDRCSPPGLPPLSLSPRPPEA